jgi:mono/diheme cytochrome c family protein
VLAITTEGRIGLGVLAGLLIVFAILSAFYFPRRNPDFPGNRLGLFVLVSVVLFVGTMFGVYYFAAMEGEGHETAAETHGTTTGGEPGSTGQTTTGAASEPAGDAAAGKDVFASAGCGSCHTLKAAGSSGTVGPNLDEAKPSFELVVERVTNGKSPMPSFKGQLTEKQIKDVAAYVVASTHG